MKRQNPTPVVAKKRPRREHEPESNQPIEMTKMATEKYIEERIHRCVELLFIVLSGDDSLRLTIYTLPIR